MATSEQKRLSAEAGLAGGGAGTVLLAIADRLPPDWGMVKGVLLYASPAASVALAALWVFAAAWVRAWKRRRDVQALIDEARQMRDRVLQDANASAQHKQKAKKNFEQFEALGIDLLKDEMTLVRAQLKAIR